MATILIGKIGTAAHVEKDEGILAERHAVKVFQFGSRGWRFILSVFVFLVWILRHGPGADLYFARFAHYHAFLLGIARTLFRKKLAIVIGGSDAVWIPRFGYGVYARPLSRWTTAMALRMADLLLPVHDSLVRGVNAYSDDPPRREGILEYHPTLRTPIRVIHNGYDPDFWSMPSQATKEDIVLAVAPADEFKVFVTKGLDHYIHVAQALPEIRFLLVGLKNADARQWWGSELPPNLTLLPSCDARSLRDLYARSKVFAHFTLTEGMPNVLCEAMLCECVPVASAVNAIPEIVGETGFLVHKQDRQAMTAAVQLALTAGLGAAARKRIMDRYPLTKRKRELLQAVDELIVGR